MNPTLKIRCENYRQWTRAQSSVSMYTIRSIGNAYSKSTYVELVQQLMEYTDVHDLNRDLYVRVLRDYYGKEKLPRILEIKKELAGEDEFTLSSLCELMYVVDESDFDPVKLPFLIFCNK